MILTDIKNYLVRRHTATLRDIALHVDAEPHAVRGMLEHWVRKGLVSKQLATASCGSSCSKCDVEATEIYHWQEDPHQQQVIPIRSVAVPPHCDAE
ncbi:MAG: sugar metabolism transcriptional regulator [Gammaproteobacteria bacterium]|nr:sugar metabolism transcriptional regulator [Gammaproteobacteria bacterium]